MTRGPRDGANGVLSLSLDPAVRTPDDPASGRILDAAVELAARGGLRAVTMDEVASRAGVGRMTVYRRFGDKQRLVQAMAVRETRRGLARVAAALDPELGFREQAAEGFVAALRVAREHPLLAGAEPREVLRGLTEPGDRTVALIRGFLAEWVREGQASGEIRALDPEAAAELLLRIGLSFVLIPASAIDYGDDEAARAFVDELIAPILAAADPG